MDEEIKVTRESPRAIEQDAPRKPAATEMALEALKKRMWSLSSTQRQREIIMKKFLFGASMAATLLFAPAALAVPTYSENAATFAPGKGYVGIGLSYGLPLASYLDNGQLAPSSGLVGSASTLMAPLIFRAGLIDRLEGQLMIPYVQNSAAGPQNLTADTPQIKYDKSVASLGRIGLAAKYQILQDDAHSPLDLSVRVGFNGLTGTSSYKSRTESAAAARAAAGAAALVIYNDRLTGGGQSQAQDAAIAAGAAIGTPIAVEGALAGTARNPMDAGVTVMLSKAFGQFNLHSNIGCFTPLMGDTINIAAMPAGRGPSGPIAPAAATTYAVTYPTYSVVSLSAEYRPMDKLSVLLELVSDADLGPIHNTTTNTNVANSRQSSLFLAPGVSFFALDSLELAGSVRYDLGGTNSARMLTPTLLVRYWF